MAGIHIDEFYADAAHTIVGLYSVFPRPVTLFAEDICGPDEPDEYGVHSHRYMACFATFQWLGEEGYIRFADTIRQDAVDQAVLSGRCFAAQLSQSPNAELNDDSTLPPSIQIERASVIYQLEEAVKSKSSTQIRTAFMPLLERMSQS
jgi:hypothetical protein